MGTGGRPRYTPHRVAQRGNGRQDVFFTDHDRPVYLAAFFDYAARYSLRVWGYCLMSHHVHLVVVPERERSLARVFGRTHADYARYLNVARRSCGHLWQARFFSYGDRLRNPETTLRAGSSVLRIGGPRIRGQTRFRLRLRPGLAARPRTIMAM